MSDSANDVRRLVVEEAQSGKRLDRYLSDTIPELSRQRLKALILSGQVTSNGTPLTSPAFKVTPDLTIELAVPEPTAAEPLPEAIPLSIAFEDAHLIVIDKPPGLVTHPAPGHETGTLVNALLAHCGADLSGIGGVRRPGIVHRLDKDTSGLLVVAKTDAAHQGLSAQFQAHGADGRLQREYLAIVWGRPERPVGQVDAAIARSPENRRKMAIARFGTGRRAVTHFEVEKSFLAPDSVPVSRLRLRLETGRTHQIRVHMASIGHPLLGDRSYGAGFRASEARLPCAARDALANLGRQALHATLLGFCHPITADRLSFESPLPADIAKLETALAGSATD